MLSNQGFQKDPGEYTLSISRRNFLVKEPLAFKIPLPANKVAILKQDDHFIAATHLVIPPQQKEITQINSATIFWDISTSASKRNITAELELLKKLIQQKSIQTLRVFCFSNAIHAVRTFSGANVASLERFLKDQVFDGGTQLGVVDFTKYPADIGLLFSDGISTFGKQNITQANMPVFTVNSNAAANHNLLHAIARSTGGMYINLNSIDVSQAMQKLMQQPVQLLAIRQAGKNVQASLALPLPVANVLTLSFALRDLNTPVEFVFGKAGKMLYTERVSFAAENLVAEDSLHEMFVLQNFTALSSEGDAQDALGLFAKEHEFVSKVTSFIVLDNLDDYIEHGITPPAELMEQYIKKLPLVKQKAADLLESKRNEEINNLRKAANLYNERIRWWGGGLATIDADNLELNVTPPIVWVGTAKENKPADNSAPVPDQFKGTSALSEVVVIGYGTQRRQSLTGSVTTISADQLSRNSPSVAQMLQGRIAGLSVTTAGTPGGTDLIRIRGAASTGAGAPLIILDGMQGGEEMLNSISPASIESISVLKDASSTAIYGSRGANGVIIITSKRAGVFNGKPGNSQNRYKNQEDVEYVTELKSKSKNELYSVYLEMLPDHQNETAFYADAAQVLFEAGDTANALRVLSNLAEIELENHQLLRGIGYILESWGSYEEAIEVYQKVLQVKDEEPQSFRDLAHAYEGNGQHKEAVDLLYKVITKNFYQYEARYRGIKSLLLNEMNAIMNRHPSVSCEENINTKIMKPLPVDLRVVIDWNKDETDIDLHVTGPDGEECFYGHKETKSGGRISDDFTQGNGPEEFEIKQAGKGKYSISVNYFGDRYQKQQVAPLVKLTIYKNYGKPNQTMSTEVFSLLNQQGKVEIATVKF